MLPVLLRLVHIVVLHREAVATPLDASSGNVLNLFRIEIWPRTSLIISVIASRSFVKLDSPTLSQICWASRWRCPPDHMDGASYLLPSIRSRHQRIRNWRWLLKLRIEAWWFVGGLGGASCQESTHVPNTTRGNFGMSFGVGGILTSVFGGCSVESIMETPSPLREPSPPKSYGITSVHSGTTDNVAGASFSRSGTGTSTAGPLFLSFGKTFFSFPGTFKTAFVRIPVSLAPQSDLPTLTSPHYCHEDMV